MVEKGSHSRTNNPYIYSFSLAVYCTAWTYYGSIGVAAESGLDIYPLFRPHINYPNVDYS
jgi:Na+/proline symporter